MLRELRYENYVWRRAYSTIFLVFEIDFLILSKHFWEKKVIRRAPTYIIYPGGALFLTYTSIGYAGYLTAEEDYSHRP